MLHCSAGPRSATSRPWRKASPVPRNDFGLERSVHLITLAPSGVGAAASSSDTSIGDRSGPRRSARRQDVAAVEVDDGTGAGRHDAIVEVAGGGVAEEEKGGVGLIDHVAALQDRVAVVVL